jgi:hypothetical protein
LVTVPSLSAALAEICMVAAAVKVAPLAGEVIVTVGGTLALTVMLMGVEVPVVLRLSVATAVRL